MSVIDKLQRQRKPRIDADLAAVIEAAVAEALAQAHPAPPPAPPQSPRMRALLRSVAQPMPAAKQPSALAPGPAATAHKDEARLAPPPYLSPIPLTEIPIGITRDVNGKIATMIVGDQVSTVTRRDANGHLLEFEFMGFKTRVTRRDANGFIAGMAITPPPGAKLRR